MTLCLIEREHEKTGLVFVKQNLDLLLLNKIFYNITILIIQGFSVTFYQFNVFLKNKSMFFYKKKLLNSRVKGYINNQFSPFGLFWAVGMQSQAVSFSITCKT